jgi:hypothetical protein
MGHFGEKTHFSWQVGPIIKIPKIDEIMHYLTFEEQTSFKVDLYQPDLIF